MAEPKERLLRKLIPPCTIAGSESEGFKLSVQDSGAWEIIAADDSAGAGFNYWAVWRGYFDLSGLVEQEETLFTINSAFQEGCDWAFTTTKPTGNLQVFDMITQEYLNDETFDGGNILTGSWVAPGMMGGSGLGGTPRTGAPYELEDVHFGRARTFQYGAVTSLGASPFTPIQTRISSWGVGNATAGQKLYVTRAILLTPAMNSTGSDSVIAPPSAVVVPSVILKEPDLHYIERLRRSYVVAPTVD